ncbi:MAG: phenylalanyl-tRNA synthetase beta chain, partial [Halieaceae bacterium]
MKVSEQWLRQWVDPAIGTVELAQQITMAGLEVDAIEAVAGQFSGVVVAEVSSAVQHPNADKLRLCEVFDGSETFQVVCGAPNARAGIKIAFARVGAVLPGNFKIKKAKLRGSESFGMICSGAELELSEDHDGIIELAGDAPVGMEFREYLDLDDQVIDIDLTPNRADCLSIAGVAREVGLLNDMSVRTPTITPVLAAIEDALTVEIVASDDCPRYVGRIIKGVDINQSSPLWMQERLRRSGVRSIDPVVDVTNYVLLELGQPMHAFDLDKLNGGIVVRMAKEGEPLVLLDGSEVELTSGSLVIADREKAVALAGIMGGKTTAVGAGTVNIFLESAFFTPEKIAGRARSYGLHTDSSHRFERGVDFELQTRAIERATALILDIVGGTPGPITDCVVNDALPARPDVVLREHRIEKILGLKLDTVEVEKILAGLGLEASRNDLGWNVSVPSWRFDISLEADLLEELARIYGYNRLPITHIHSDLAMKPASETSLSLRSVRRQLVGRGYREAITYSFVEPALQQRIEPEIEAIALVNPISADMAVMRTTLLPGLLTTVLRNTNRQQSRVRIFETGLRFRKIDGETSQEPTLAMAITGRRAPESWSAGSEAVDFYDIKGDLESIFALTGRNGDFGFRPASHPAMHPGQTAAVFSSEKLMGYVGAIHPALAAELDLSAAVFLLEIELSGLLEAKLPNFEDLSKFPEVRRDLAVVVDKSVLAGDVLKTVQDTAGSGLT